jgi:hypothetical protein
MSRTLSRAEFYASIGLFKEIDPITEEAYDFVERLERERPNRGKAAGDNWHLSFHGSQFPGDDPNACARKALYTMMDAPRRKAGRWLSQIAETGKDIEDRIVGRWYQAGYLVSAPPPPFGDLQTVYEDSEHWLTSTVDAEVLPLKSDTIIVTEVKCKYDKDVRQMINLVRGPDEAHVRQIKTQVGMSREFGSRVVARCYNSGRLAIKLGVKNKRTVIICPQHGHADCLHEVTIQPPNYGRLFYMSRDDPAVTREFFYEYDSGFLIAGRARLKLWRGYWEQGVLPQTDFKGKHPFGWNWTTAGSPCRWCDFGTNVGNRTCQADHNRAKELGTLLRLEDSEAILEARRERPNYDYNLVRAAVEARWKKSA